MSDIETVRKLMELDNKKRKRENHRDLIKAISILTILLFLSMCLNMYYLSKLESYLR